MKIIKVGMADLNIVKAPGILTTLGLGSCVGIALYDRYNKIAGLAHVMLPSSKEIKNNENKSKFVDTGIELLIEMMIDKGAIKRNLTAKIAGGSQMFSFNNNSSILKIGERNVLATKEKLKELNIEILSEDTGGNYGRTIELNAEDGSLLIKTIGHGIKII
ncbi:sequence specific deamidase required for methylation of methyl-accepting chemotaxis proteins (MCPs) by CheR [[Clostridium] ultunense Esp]|uniref:Probable chemoreceptor glutamine deamidase CheD n=1 Tax=[Clostridium] ultunense Esp TaxID=1288971 RepID=M1ZGV2_9FIRM|nr:chemotaxis protein CheR [Schnuerera ultunensis]CCQ93037.1 sequence specific deamidase required for methylation of methyl-accepting chemotaxis proteins (MCPs) by CheR [[Clostridium] ultunense Esp]SHD77040.1 sequence specific deamidase required for methylation of methyl-accepting chemotaxis proteins (MCPs) by CheR [[Clostridium] ultunense Esp]